MTGPFSAGAIAAFTALLAVAPGCAKSATRGPLRIAAAADLAFAFEELGNRFQAETKQAVTFSFGSTGQLAKQIEEGAPFDLFAAANVTFADQVVKAGACDGATKRIYGRGRVGVWTPRDVRPVVGLGDLVGPRFVKIAIANPEHAPYGRAAKEALVHAGLWEKVLPKIVYGENVQQTLKFAQSGNAEAALVALSLAKASDGHFFLIDEAAHQPLDQALVVCNRGARSTEARAFAAIVMSAGGREVMKRFGFVLPGETPSGEAAPGEAPPVKP